MKSTSTPVLPNGDMEIVFSFDTTGSMHHCLERVRKSLKEIMERLFADIPGLKVALFAHGDYCDRDNYVTKYIDFTNNVAELCKFASSVKPTEGGDIDECYELVLRQVRSELSWSPGSQRALVMIGDACPHLPNYSDNKLKIDWKNETKLLQKMGVTIYGVNCGDDDFAVKFFEHISEKTGGRKIQLDDISSVTQMLMAVCYREKGSEYFEAFEREVRASKDKITHTLSGMFDALRSEVTDTVELPVSSPAPSTRKRAHSPKAKKAAPKRKRESDAVGETPVTKHRRSSVSSGTSRTSTGSSTKVRKHKIATRSNKHRMTLRKRLAVLNGGVQKKKSPRSPSKSPRSPYPVKVARESVLGKQFLSELEWTPWKLAMMGISSPFSTEWSVRPGMRAGIRREALFEDTEIPAVYEFAVATPASTSKYPVYASVTKGFTNQTWENKFLSQGHLQKQIHCVLLRDCQIYARRAPIPVDDDAGDDGASVMAELRHVLTTKYDYAWQEHYNTETRTYHHRRLYKNGVLISE